MIIQYYPSSFSLFYFSIYLLSSVIDTYFIHNYLKPKYRYSLYLVFAAFSLLEISYVLFRHISIVLWLLISVIVIYILVFTLYDGPTYRKRAAPWLLGVAIYLSNIFLISCIIYLFQLKMIVLNSPILFGLIEICCDGITFLIILFFLRWANKQVITPNAQKYHNLLIMASCPTLLISIFLLLDYINYISYSRIYIIHLIIICIILDFLIIKEVIKLNESIKNDIIQVETNKLYQDLLIQYLEISETTNDYRAIRHDLINYIETMKLEEKGDEK